MPITVVCKQCGKTMSAPATAAGKKGKCSACGAVIEIPVKSDEEPLIALTEAPATPSPAAIHKTGPARAAVMGHGLHKRPQTLTGRMQQPQGSSIVKYGGGCLVLCFAIAVIGVMLKPKTPDRAEPPPTPALQSRTPAVTSPKPVALPSKVPAPPAPVAVPDSNNQSSKPQYGGDYDWHTTPTIPLGVSRKQLIRGWEWICPLEKRSNDDNGLEIVTRYDEFDTTSMHSKGSDDSIVTAVLMIQMNLNEIDSPVVTWKKHVFETTTMFFGNIFGGDFDQTIDFLQKGMEEKKDILYKTFMIRIAKAGDRAVIIMVRKR